MAQIKVNTDLIKPKSIHVYNSSAQLWLNDRVGYVRVNGEWVPFIEYKKYLYKSGVNLANIVGNRFPIKFEDNHIFASIYPSDTEWLTIVTNDRVDVTKYDTLCYDVEVTKGGQSGYAFGISAKEKTYPEYDAETVIYVYANEPRRIVKVDISKFKGMYYVKMMTPYPTGGIRTTRELKIYNIWME